MLLESYGRVRHGGTFVCQLSQDMKVLGSNLDKDKKKSKFKIQNIHHIVCVYSWLETNSCVILTEI